MKCYSIGPGAIVLAVRLTPKSRLDAVDGSTLLADGRRVLAVRVRAVPAGGAANDSMTTVLADLLKVPRSAIAIVGGATSRLKRVRVTGAPQELATILDRLPER